MKKTLAFLILLMAATVQGVTHYPLVVFSAKTTTGSSGWMKIEFGDQVYVRVHGARTDHGDTTSDVHVDCVPATPADTPTSPSEAAYPFPVLSWANVGDAGAWGALRPCSWANFTIDDLSAGDKITLILEVWHGRARVSE